MDHFTSLSRHYKREFPHLKLSIRRVRCSGYGFVRETEGRLCVRIRTRIDPCLQLILLVHELGHALTYRTDLHPSDHGPIFGQGYATAWRSYLRWMES